MTSDRILFVDDEPNVLAAYKRSLHKRFTLSTCTSGDEGLSRLRSEGPFAVLVADMQMPGMNGVELLRKAQELSPDTVRLMLTGNADQKTAVDAVNQGHVFSFLTKPCSPETLSTMLGNALRQHHLIRAEKELLEQTLNGAVKVLVEVLSTSDPDSFGRAERLRDEMRIVAQWFKAANAWEMELGAMLSQIGWVSIPPSLAARSRSGETLSIAEANMIARVPEFGAALIQNIPRLASVADIVRYQGKNFDGSGSPADSVAGEAIPIGARILRVLAALVEGESEKASRADVFQRLRRTSGLYDPKVVEAIAACFDVYLGQPDLEPAPIVAVKLREVRIGSVLVQDVMTRDGTLLVTANTPVTPPLLHKLRNFDELMGLNEPLFVRHSSPH